MPNEEERKADGRSLRGALVCATVGAALFLGVGAALPMWPTSIGAYRPGWAEHDAPRYATLWEAAVWLKCGGGPRGGPPLLPSMFLQDNLVRVPAILLAFGGVAGMYGCIAWLRLRRRKGLGA